MRIANQPDIAGGQFGKALRRREHAHARAQPGFRKNRDRETGQNGGRYRARVRAREQHVVGPSDRLQLVYRALPPHAARPAERERQPLLEMDGMAVRRHPEQPLAPEAFRRPRALAVGDDGEIKLVLVDQFDQLDRRLARDGELDARIGAREPRHDFGQIAVCVIVRHAEPHAPAELRIRKGGQRLDVELDDAARVIEQPLAVLGELRGAAIAREDGPVEPFLQALHLHRHGRLGLVHEVGRLGETAGLGDGDEGAQLVDVDERGHARAPGGWQIRIRLITNCDWLD